MITVEEKDFQYITDVNNNDCSQKNGKPGRKEGYTIYNIVQQFIEEHCDENSYSIHGRKESYGSSQKKKTWLLIEDQ